MSFWMALAVVIYFVVMLAAMGIALVWLCDGDAVVGGVAAIVSVAMLAYGVSIISQADASDQSRCLESGGAWTRTGTEHGMVMAGKVMVQTEMPTYGCVEVSR